MYGSRHSSLCRDVNDDIGMREADEMLSSSLPRSGTLYFCTHVLRACPHVGRGHKNWTFTLWRRLLLAGEVIAHKRDLQNSHHFALPLRIIKSPQNADI